MMVRRLSSVTGMEWDRAALWEVASRVSDNTRRLNIREGLIKMADNLPARFFNEPLPETGKVITESELDRMLSDYSAERNWEERGLIG